MKINILTLTLLGISAILINYSCDPTSRASSNQDETICSNYTDISTLEVGLIHAMTKKYKENQLSTINQFSKDKNHYFDEPQLPNEPHGDSRTIWFDLETLKAFVYQIEMNAKTKVEPPIPSTDLGIRIYYASYPDTNYWGDYKDLIQASQNNTLPENYQRRHTLVLIPTINRDGHNADFNPLDSPTFTKPLSSQLAKYSPESSVQMLALTGINKSTSNQRDSGQNQNGQNHGGLYPPPPGGDGVEF